MKKLLSLLSVITITGTSAPTVIAASLYQKEKTIKNSDITYTETNNLENTNNYSWWDLAYLAYNLVWNGTKKITDYIKLNFLTEEINIYIEEIKTLENSEVKKVIFDYFKNEFYLLTSKTNNLYKIKSNGFLQLIHSPNPEIPNDYINGFSLDSKLNRNIYIFTTNKLYKNNIYDIKEEISNIGFNHFFLDNEDNIIFQARDNDIDFLSLIKHDEEDIPKNIDEVYKLRKINLPVNSNTVFHFDEYNNIYIKSINNLYMLKKYDINPIKINGTFSHDNYTGWNFYAIKDNIFMFSDKKFYHLKSGQTSITEIPMAEIYDHYLDSKQENFYIATEKGIYKFNIIDQENKKISSIITTKISIDKSDNIFIKTNNEFWYNELLILLKKDDGSYKEYKILSDLQIGTYEKIFNINKKIYLFTNTNNIFKVYYFDRLDEWINAEEKENNEIEKKANRLEQERLDKERKDWIEVGGKQREKEWKINKLKEIEEYLQEKEQQGKATPFEKKLLACFKKHIPDGFALGFGVLGGIIGSAIAPGTGTISGSVIGTAIGKWIGGIVGDAIKETVPGEESCKF